MYGTSMHEKASRYERERSSVTPDVRLVRWFATAVLYV